MKQKQKENAVFSGVFVLLLANLFVKVIGMLFKIPIQHLIGDGGMGYFNVAYHIYTWFYMLSTAGLPVAISVMISEANAKGRGRRAKIIFRCAVSVFTLIGLAGMLVMILSSRLLSRAVGMEQAYLCIIAIAPTLFFVCIASAVRGYFQGFQNMIPTAVSQVIEAAGKMILGLLLALFSISKGYDLYVTAAFAISGITLGSFASMLFCIASKFLIRVRQTDGLLPDDDAVSRRRILKQLITIAVPITLSASVMSLTNIIDVAISSRRLQSIGYSEAVAGQIFGNYSTLAVSMFNLPLVLVYPISYSVVPALSGAMALKDRVRIRRIINSAFKMMSLIALPCSFGIAVLSKPILSLLFREESAALAAPMLSILSASIFFCSVLAITTSVLQASGNERLPIISMLIGAACKLVSGYFLIGIPKIGRYGIPLGTCICYFVIILINLYFVTKHTGIFPNVRKTFLLPLVSALVCGFTAHLAYRLLSELSTSRLTVLPAIFIAGAVYVLMLFLTRAIDRDDISVLPKSEKIYSILKRLHAVK